MDLKDITRGLRGSDERTQADDQSRTTADARPGAAQSSTSDSTADRPDSTTDGPADPDRDDEHVCSFCQAEFDADRGVCPECDAEIVFRGTR